MIKVLTFIILFTVSTLFGVGEAQMTEPSRLDIPPIDMSHSGDFRTATFALG